MFTGPLLPLLALLTVLNPVPVLGGNGGLSSPGPSIRFGGGVCLGAAIDLLGGGGCGLDCDCDCGSGSSRYRCGGGEGVEDGFGALARREGFLFGIGGGAGLRAIWLCREDWAAAKGWRDGREGSECVDAFDGVREMFEVRGSLVPSTFGIVELEVEPGVVAPELYWGTMSFLAIGFEVLFKLVVELDGGFGPLPLKSTVCALAVPLAGGGSGLSLFPILLTSTQSGSGLGVNGLLGRFGFGKWSLLGGCTLDRAGRPCKEDKHESKSRDQGRYTVIQPPLPAIRARGRQPRLDGVVPYEIFIVCFVHDACSAGIADYTAALEVDFLRELFFLLFVDFADQTLECCVYRSMYIVSLSQHAVAPCWNSSFFRSVIGIGAEVVLVRWHEGYAGFGIVREGKTGNHVDIEL